MILGGVGDTHFRAEGLDAITAAWEETLEVCRRREVQLLLHDGDVFDSFNVAGRSASFGTVFAAFTAPLYAWLHEDDRRKALIIPGNHDILCHRRDAGQTEFRAYKALVHGPFRG